MVILIAVFQKGIQEQISLLQIREERYMLYIQGMVIGILSHVNSPPLPEDCPKQIASWVRVGVWIKVSVRVGFIGFQLNIFFSFIKYDLKNFRVLVIYQTEFIERNRNFEPNLLSFFITQSLVANCMSTDFTK